MICWSHPLHHPPHTLQHLHTHHLKTYSITYNKRSQYESKIKSMWFRDNDLLLLLYIPEPYLSPKLSTLLYSIVCEGQGTEKKNPEYSILTLESNLQCCKQTEITHSVERAASQSQRLCRVSIYTTDNSHIIVW